MDRKRPAPVPSAVYALAAVYGLVAVGIALIATSAVLSADCQSTGAKETLPFALAPTGGIVLAVATWLAARKVMMRKPSATTVFVVGFAIMSVAFEIPALAWAKHCAS